MTYQVPSSSSSYNFILASGSPRRRELLQMLGVDFTIVLPESSGRDRGDIQKAGVDETPLPDETPSTLVQRLSRAKVLAVAKLLSSDATRSSVRSINNGQKNTIIIAADTVVVLGNKILGKPSNRAEATDMLRRLRDQQDHRVYSGLSVGIRYIQPRAAGFASKIQIRLNYDTQLVTRIDESKVWMRSYTDDEINAYVAGGDPMDKAGAYGIQNKTFAPVEHLDGCFASVMGLPLGELSAALKEIGISLPQIAPLCTQYTGYSCCQQ